MGRAGAPTSPWVYDSGADVNGLHLRITIPWDDTVTGSGTGNIQNGTVVHKDPGCQWNTVVFDVPSGPNAKPLPLAPDGDTTLTAVQIRNATGFRTITDLQSVQVTAYAG